MANHIGFFFVLLFVVCFAWYFIHPVEQEMHLAMFRMSFFGFSGMNFVSFVLGAIQVYVWGYILVGLGYLMSLVCGCCKKGKCGCSK
ncbi:hypothetical protein HOF40_02120 [Candidatus Parcubacteria bacterium]|nr:hypothetical protein [Candidatus Parcubacteria bacterium]